EAFARMADVSRETTDRLARHLDLLRRWQKRINLVGAATLADPWRRHMLDSAQLAPLIPAGARLADLGSGAGFPGLVLAILRGGPVHLIESDARKAAFLHEAVRATGAPAEVHNARAENLELRANVVTARACAPLDRLLGLALPLLAPGGICLFLKGARVEEELAVARRRWRMTVRRRRSRSAPEGVVLELGGLAHAG
ncbi:MAG: 16S rRNA (guanine(527)-N(7))-methyltransferase RsmG, partial [Alphaproteobacteria bacterium]|nr:16S rRNA (guanine(527)-N(7))-methyltransferase RsmG [Alphaproteobacteria bacterium]